MNGISALINKKRHENDLSAMCRYSKEASVC